MKTLYRSKKNKVLAGVCGGIAEYTNLDPTLVRLLAVVAAFMSVGIIVYIVAIFIMPEAPDNYNKNDQS